MRKECFPEIDRLFLVRLTSSSLLKIGASRKYILVAYKLLFSWSTLKQLIFAFVLGGWWWWLIVVINCPPTIHFKFITKCVKCYYKVRWSVIKSATAFLFESETILLQSVSMITKCERTTWEFLKFRISKHPARRDQRRGYWLPTWLSGVFYHFDRKGIHHQTAIEDWSSALTN